MFNPFFIL